MYRKILVPTDGSALSQQAATAAIEFARAHGAELLVLCVAQPDPLMLADGAMAAGAGGDSRTLLEAARQSVDQVLQQARAAGVACRGTVALSFLPHEEIIRAAAEHGCDLVFMASHGRRGLSRLLAGSVTQNVLAYSNIPVLVLRPGAPA
jgi:nucleotide-binding universal stress UspA family protein